MDGLTITGASSRGLYINNHTNPSIIRCKFDGNGGYGIYADNYSYPAVTDCNFFENNQAGIYSDNSSWPYISNCVFDDNYNASSSSYGLEGSSSTMTIEDCIIRRQTSSGISFTASDIIVNRCEIENNRSNGISCSNTNLNVMGCTIQNNGNDGINIQGQNGVADLTGSSNTIRFNAHQGIYTDHCESITIKNNLVLHNGNSGTDSGLNLQYSISPPYVRNNTIVGNIPYGIYVYDGFDPCLTNDIIYNNGTGTSQNIYSTNGLSGVSASYCDIGGGFAGTGNRSCDPCFKSL